MGYCSTTKEQSTEIPQNMDECRLLLVKELVTKSPIFYDSTEEKCKEEEIQKKCRLVVSRGCERKGDRQNPRYEASFLSHE